MIGMKSVKKKMGKNGRAVIKIWKNDSLGPFVQTAVVSNQYPLLGACGAEKYC